MLTYRCAARADVPVILELLADDDVARERAAHGEPVSPSRDAAVWAAFEAIDEDPRNELIVAERDGAVVGTFQLTFVPSLSRGGAERMIIEAVRVRSDLRGRGLGRDMIRWALDRGRARGCGIAQLTTDKRRRDAHRFYASLGFAASHEGMKIAL
ncbi:GNAT family N-acetyltransferase [Mangrovihabitans endophyticus]|uniref:Acetyltransferase n=1 Tax=Mangrovihabitans endophyticus TaxID=1751298 RepID=A0A8J3FQD2_9ACTN|nr:GNAT family N-acetyltransferase [Mangrovihabitans endophyticus]GGL06521.1 acetyltransferase [Mangrovihabitans endophyticus]